MAFLSRIKQTKINYLSCQFKRCYFQFTIPCLADYVPSYKLSRGSLHQPNCIVHRRPGEISDNARFFAAPAQIKKKVEEDSSGPRLNDQIKAQFVRLVAAEGHGVVPLQVALQRAQNLRLDLVEVQRDPCVVKIMDYHKERYLQQVKEKDRAKSKAAVTLRKGDCKEVRFSPKCEQKDLKMKADTAKRLMERGYRVKCMVMGTEDQDLGEMLSRLSSMIEDIAVVESGPRVERKQAYIIARHEKFGPSKKGGKKAAKAAKTGPSGSGESDLEASEDSTTENNNYGEASSSQELDSPLPTKCDEANWSLSSVTNNNYEKMFDYSDSQFSDSGSIDPQQMAGIGRTASPSFSVQPQPETENRYIRQGGPRVGQVQIQRTNNSANPDARNANQQLSGQRPGPGWARGTDSQAGQGWARQAKIQVDRHWNQGVSNQVGPDVRNSGRACNEVPKSEAAGVGEGSSQSTSYGVFSSPSLNRDGAQGGGAAVGQNSRPRSCGFPSNAGSRTGSSGLGSPMSRAEGNSGDGRWGIFSRDGSDTKADQGVNSQAKA